MEATIQETISGRVVEETLTDGSKAYNVYFQGHKFGALSKATAESLLDELEMSCAWIGAAQ